MNLTPWDVQSKHIYTTDGVAPPLYSGECRYGGGEAYIFVRFKAKDNADDTNGSERPGRWSDPVELRRNFPCVTRADEAPRTDRSD